MAAESTPKRKVLTWQEKLKQEIPLNELDRIKYDAHRATMRRIKEQEEERAIAEADKARLTSKEVKAMQPDSKKGE